MEQYRFNSVYGWYTKVIEKIQNQNFAVYKALYENFGILAVYKQKKAV